MKIIAIDPGASGAAVGRYDGDLVVNTFSNPTFVEFNWLFKTAVECGIKTLLIEKVALYKSMGGVLSLYNQGRNYGRIEQAAYDSGITEIYEILAKEWQAGLGLVFKNRKEGKAGYNEKKQFLKEEAQRMYPNLKVTKANADALLMYEYARRFYGAD